MILNKSKSRVALAAIRVFIEAKKNIAGEGKFYMTLSPIQIACIKIRN
jgi:hypothetical protein